MNYRQKTIQSMAFYLKKRYDAIEKIDALKELKTIWATVDLSDMVKSYKLAFEE